MSTSATARKLAQLRSSQNLSQQWLANAAGIHVRTIRRIEKGARAPLSKLETIARALHVEPERLIDHTNPTPHDSFVISANTDSFADFAEIIASLDAIIRITRILALWQPPHPWASAEERKTEFESDPVMFEKRRIQRLIYELGAIHDSNYEGYSIMSLNLPLANRILHLESRIHPGTLMHPDEHEHTRDLVELSIARKNSPILVEISVYLATIPELGTLARSIPFLVASILERVGQRVRENREYRLEQRRITLESRRAVIRRYEVGTDILEAYSSRVASADTEHSVASVEVLGPLVSVLASTTPELMSHLESVEAQVKGGPLEAGYKKTTK